MRWSIGGLGLLVAFILSWEVYARSYVAPRAAIPLPASHRRPPQSTYHWRLGQSKDGALAELTWLQDSWLDDQNSRLWTTNGPLNVVPKRARFAGLAHAEARPPDSAVYIDRPPVGSLVEIPINCLASRNSSLSRRKLSTWTVEAVVYFLDSPHLGRAWQGIIGRDGANFSRNVDLSTLYLKLDPERRFMLEAWLDDNPAVTLGGNTDKVFDLTEGLSTDAVVGLAQQYVLDEDVA